MKLNAVVLAVALISNVAAARDGMEILQADCASCHNLKGPAPQTLQQLWARKGPDLFYAGNKYREEWVESWLQHPSRIRPAGMFYVEHVKPGAKNDEVDAASLGEHVALNKSDAESVAHALMKLKPHDELIGREKIEPGTISKSMGEMVFDKFWGCLACHRIEPEYGGLSGPELYTAGKRLQSEYIASFIRSPQAWDPKSLMPNKQANDSSILQLTHYLEGLSKEAANAK